jgi:Uma2 family endonuclease
MPDLAWWRHDKCSGPDQPLAVEGPPDLVVEVLSPSTRRIDTVLKRHDYPTIGVREMWFVDPEEPYVLQVLQEAGRERVTDLSPDDTLTSPQLDGFTLAVGRLTERRPTLGTPRG